MNNIVKFINKPASNIYVDVVGKKKDCVRWHKTEQHAQKPVSSRWIYLNSPSTINKIKRTQKKQQLQQQQPQNVLWSELTCDNVVTIKHTHKFWEI